MHFKGFILHIFKVIYCRYGVQDFMAQRYCESGDLVRTSNFDDVDKKVKAAVSDLVYYYKFL